MSFTALCTPIYAPSGRAEINYGRTPDVFILGAGLVKLQLRPRDLSFFWGL